jgi:hypothetical protein
MYEDFMVDFEFEVLTAMTAMKNIVFWAVAPRVLQIAQGI